MNNGERTGPDSKQLLIVRACALVKFNIEIVFGVVITDVLYHASQKSHIIGRFACFDQFAKEGAEEAAEVVMARVGEKTSRVCQHADKAAEQA